MARPRKKALVSWKDRAREKAKERSALRPASESSLISIKGGVFTYGGAPMAEELDVVVLDEVPEFSIYKGPYAEGEFQLPMCWALGTPMSMASEGQSMFSGMKPYQNVEEPQSEYCYNCEKNQYKSGKGGRGKACSNRRRLMLMAADNLDKLDSAMIAILKIPPTGLKLWDAHADWLYRIHETTPEYCVTRITLRKIKSTDQSPIPFYEQVAFLPDEVCDQIDTIVERNRGTLIQPFPDSAEEKPTKRVRKKRAVRR